MEKLHSEQKPLHPHFGIEIKDFSLVDSTANAEKESADDIIASIKTLVHQHRVVVFRNQGTLSAYQQISLTEWFGEVDCCGFEEHPQSPHPLILRVSNEESQGCRDFGTAGFHVDGSFNEKPNAYSIYHMVQASSKGCTAFVPLNEVYIQLSEYKRMFWQRLWLLKTYKRIARFRESPGFVIHPLVYTHPVTQKQTLCIHQGKTSRFLLDWGLTVARWTSKDETAAILADIDKELHCSESSLIYHHEWADGDLILSDNLALGHVALPDTQLPASEVGVRIMHRTVVKGTNRPWKSADVSMVTDDDAELEDNDVILANSFGDKALFSQIKHRLSRP